MNEAEEQINHMEDKIMENKKTEKKRVRKLLDHERRLRELCNSIKWNDIRIRGVPGDEDQEKRGRSFI